MVDLSRYAEQILAVEDHPLFDDAVEAGKVGALRAAYMMIWLACAESLKRRFREAQKRDVTAGKIVGEIETKERDHKSVDKFVLEKAKTYGFVSDSGHTILSHIYEMRCVYAHPYEEAPSSEQVLHAAAGVVEHVLSKPVKLRHGFGKHLLDNLLHDRSYLDDEEMAVVAFTKDILPRIDESIHGWLLDKYWEEIEKIVDDASVALFCYRALWFSRTILIEVGVDVFSPDDWHDRFSKFPKTLICVCSVVEIFSNIGQRAQDSLVGCILTESDIHPRFLTFLEWLSDGGALSQRQQERFVEYVSTMKLSSLRTAGLSTKTCYERLIGAMKSHNWYVQNPAIDVIISNGSIQAAELNEEQQVNLGRNLLQSGEGGASSAYCFLEQLSQDGSAWPFDFVRGIVLELFTNEKNEIRFKENHLDRVLSALNHLNEQDQNRLISEIMTSVNAGTIQDYWVSQDDFKNVIKSLQAYTWSAPLVRILQEKAV